VVWTYKSYSKGIAYSVVFDMVLRVFIYEASIALVQSTMSGTQIQNSEHRFLESCFDWNSMGEAMGNPKPS
jgi:hypothetical protein